MLQRLAEDRLHELLPVAMVTAKGMPDLATRAFLCRQASSSPGHPPMLACFRFLGQCTTPRCNVHFARAAAPHAGNEAATPKRKAAQALCPLHL